MSELSIERRVACYREGYEARHVDIQNGTLSVNPYADETGYDNQYYEWRKGYLAYPNGMTPDWYSRVLQGD